MEPNSSHKDKVRAKLRKNILKIRGKSTNPNLTVVKLFNSVQFIAARIKAEGRESMTEVDQEYILLVKSYLPKEAKVSWLKTGNNG